MSGTMPRIPRVVVVDDEPAIVRALCWALSHTCNVRGTTHPEEALGWLVSDEWVDVVLCDLMMPAMSGVELHRRVHAARPERAARFVFVTGGVFDDGTRRSLDLLPNLVITKPCEVSSLLALIARRTGAIATATG